MLTLVALEECYVQDKVAALPLFLRLFDSHINPQVSSAGDSIELLPAYGAFIRNASSQYEFINSSP